jgi:dihydrofolate reductase
MKLSLIVAMADNNAIGLNHTLPWHLPADLKHFKQITTGKPVLMGRKTFDAIGRPLPERTNIVVTRDTTYEAPGCVATHSIEEALIVAGDAEEVMVIGGAEFYRQLLPRADRIYLTRVHGVVDGDVFFPEIDDTEWQEVERIDHTADEKNAYDYSFIRLERIAASPGSPG